MAPKTFSVGKRTVANGSALVSVRHCDWHANHLRERSSADHCIQEAWEVVSQPRPYCSTNNCSCTCCRAYTFAGGVRQSTFHTFYVGDLDNESWGNRTLNPSPYPVLTCLCRSESCCRGRRSHTGWVSVELLTRRVYRAGRTFEYRLWPQDFYLDKPSLNLFTRLSLIL